MRQRRQAIQSALARATHRAGAELGDGAEAERRCAQAEAVLASADAAAVRSEQQASERAERILARCRGDRRAITVRAQRRIDDAERGARLVRERTAAEVERLQRETHQSSQTARAELIRVTEEARADADRIREEARTMLERAREVSVLAGRREDITRQLGHLSGVIEALAVPEPGRRPRHRPDHPRPHPRETEHHTP